MIGSIVISDRSRAGVGTRKDQAGAVRYSAGGSRRPGAHRTSANRSTPPRRLGYRSHLGAPTWDQGTSPHRCDPLRK